MGLYLCYNSLCVTPFVHEAKLHTRLSSKAIFFPHQTLLPGQSTHAMARSICRVGIVGPCCVVSKADAPQVKQAALRVILNFVAAPKSLSDLLPGAGKDGQAARGRPQRDRPQASSAAARVLFLPTTQSQYLSTVTTLTLGLYISQ